MTFIAAFPLPSLFERAIYATASQYGSRAASDYWLEGLTLSIFPVLAFFSLLFYTDVPSVIAVLASYVAMMKGRHHLASLAGLASLLFRQTNVVWCAFIASQALLNALRRASKVEGKKRDDGSASRTGELETLSGMIQALIRFGVIRTVKLLAPYLSIPIAFGAYLVWNNGSIVLGHQQYHSASLHGAQLLYFSVFVTAMSWPALASEGLKGTISGALHTGLGTWSRRLCSLIALAAILAVIHYQT